MNDTVSLLLAKAIKARNNQRVGHEAAISRYLCTSAHLQMFVTFYIHI